MNRLRIYICALWAGSVVLMSGCAGSRPAEKSLRHDFTPRRQLVYALSYNGTSHTDFRALFAGAEGSAADQGSGPIGMQQNSQIALTAVLRITFQQPAGNGYALIFKLDEVRADLAVNGVREPFSTLVREEIARPVIARLSTRGNLTALYFDAATTRFTQGVYRAIIAKTQFVLPDMNQNAGEWQAAEEDANGWCIVEYKAAARDAAPAPSDALGEWSAYRKTKIAYQPQAATEAKRDIVPKGTSHTGFSLSRGCLVWIAGDEEEQISIGDKLVGTGRTQSRLTLRESRILDEPSFTDLSGQAARILAAAETVSLSARPSQEELARTVSRGTLGSATLATLTEELRQAEQKGESRNTPLFLKFRSLIVLQSQCAGDLGIRLAAAQPGSLTSRVLMDALASAGNDEAQKALVTIVESKAIDAGFRIELIQKLGMVQKPAAAAENALLHLAQTSDQEYVFASAAANLGAMARSLSELDPARSRKITGWLLGQAERPGSENRLNWIIMALGNSGALQALPALKRQSLSSSSTIRVTTAMALRWIDSEEADQLLASILRSDADAMVRMEAAGALSYRKPVPLTIAAQKSALNRDQSPFVRIAVLKNLWNARGEIQELMSIVKEVADNDPSEDVRKTAAEMLAKLPSG